MRRRNQVFRAVVALAICACCLGSTAPPVRAQVNRFDAPPTSAGAASPVPTTGISSLDRAIWLQRAGNRAGAIRSYNDAVDLLDQIVQAPLPLDVAHIARDRLAFAVLQLAVLQHDKSDVQANLKYVFTIERKYINYQALAARDAFAAGRFRDGFEVYAVFAKRAGDDVRTGRPHTIYEALEAAGGGDFDRARLRLIAAGKEDADQFGDSERLYFLGEVERALHHEGASAEAFWEAVGEPESADLQYGLIVTQVLAADALRRDPA